MAVLVYLAGHRSGGVVPVIRTIAVALSVALDEMIKDIGDRLPLDIRDDIQVLKDGIDGLSDPPDMQQVRALADCAAATQRRIAAWQEQTP